MSERDFERCGIDVSVLTALKLHGYVIQKFNVENNCRYRILKEHHWIAFYTSKRYWRIYATEKIHYETLKSILGNNNVYIALL